MELPHMFSVTTDTARGKWRSHRIADGFLYGRERLMGRIRSAIGIQPGLRQKISDIREVIGRNEPIGIKDDEIIPFGTLKTEIACKSLPCVRLNVIMHIDAFPIPVYDLLCIVR